MLPKVGWRRVCAALALTVIGFGLVGYPEERLSHEPLTSTRILDRHGELLYERRGRTGGYAQPVRLPEISPHLVAATLSGEDAHFRYHPGVDPLAIVRAIGLNVQCRCLGYGGSTITQQLAKQLDPQPRTLWGKTVEASDAFRLELSLSKDELLEQYLNRVYYGRLAYGAEAASQRFFGKSAKNLTLDEAALLAVLPRAPTRYDPDRHPHAALRRRAHVLDVMAEREWITADDAEAAKNAPLRLVNPRTERHAAHVIDYFENEVFSEVGGFASLETTLDLNLQRGIERRLRDHLSDLDPRDVDQAGVVVLDNASGEVLAMVGSRRYGEAAVAGASNVTLALRPPGSTLKPFVYALAFEDGASLDSPIVDERTYVAGYQPRAAGGRHFGQVTLREALASSLNAPAVRLAHRVGTDRVERLLLDLGIEQEAKPRGLGIALGGTSVRLVDLANGYATLARGGRHLPWTLVRRPEVEARQVLDRNAALEVTRALSDPRARRLQFGLETPIDAVELEGVAAKTGTSQSYGDNLTVGYTTSITVAVWVGNFDGRPMRSVIAMRGAAPLWADVMRLVMEEREPRAFDSPTRRRAGAAAASWQHPPAPQFRVQSPREGMMLVLDPTVARDGQRLPLEAEAPPDAELLRWEVDGTMVGETRRGARLYWPLEPGAHTARVFAIDSRGVVLTVSGWVRFEVQEEIG